MPKQNRVFAVLALPFAVCLFFIGWVMFSVGLASEERARQKKASQPRDELEFIAVMPEKKVAP